MPTVTVAPGTHAKRASAGGQTGDIEGAIVFSLFSAVTWVDSNRDASDGSGFEFWIVFSFHPAKRRESDRKRSA